MTFKLLKRVGLSLYMFTLLSMAAVADTQEAEIQYLLETVGQSGCVFIRNGKTHAATDAESHLRMKYSNGKFWVDDAEEFIERIATKSSWSGDAYLIECPNADRQPSAAWLVERLAAYRKGQ